jgi:hypothetical protein
VQAAVAPAVTGTAKPKKNTAKKNAKKKLRKAAAFEKRQRVAVRAAQPLEAAATVPAAAVPAAAAVSAAVSAVAAAVVPVAGVAAKAQVAAVALAAPRVAATDRHRRSPRALARGVRLCPTSLVFLPHPRMGLARPTLQAATWLAPRRRPP